MYTDFRKRLIDRRISYSCFTEQYSEIRACPPFGNMYMQLHRSSGPNALYKRPGHKILRAPLKRNRPRHLSAFTCHPQAPSSSRASTQLTPISRLRQLGPAHYSTSIHTPPLGCDSAISAYIHGCLLFMPMLSAVAATAEHSAAQFGPDAAGVIGLLRPKGSVK